MGIDLREYNSHFSIKEVRIFQNHWKSYFFQCLNLRPSEVAKLLNFLTRSEVLPSCIVQWHYKLLHICKFTYDFGVRYKCISFSFQALFQNIHAQMKVLRYKNYVCNRFIFYPQRFHLHCTAIHNSFIHSLTVFYGSMSDRHKRDSSSDRANHKAGPFTGVIFFTLTITLKGRHF